MTDAELTRALDELANLVGDPSRFFHPFLNLFPVSGVAVSTVGDLLGSETISASDGVAARVDELQFDLGEGPCWDAMASARPVLEPDLRRHPRTVWPAFSAAILDLEVSSLFAFPLAVGPLRIGAVDLYAAEATDLTPAQTKQAAVMAEATGRHVLRRALEDMGFHAEDNGNAYSRRLVHQATGMVLAQLQIGSEDARLVIEGHAFAASRSMMEVAQDIVDRRLSFVRGGTGFEVSP